MPQTPPPLSSFTLFRYYGICFWFSLTVPHTSVPVSKRLWKSVGDEYQLSMYKVYPFDKYGAIRTMRWKLWITDLSCVQSELLAVSTTRFTHFVILQSKSCYFWWIELNEWYTLLCSITRLSSIAISCLGVHYDENFQFMYSTSHFAQLVSAIYCFKVKKVQISAEENKMFQGHHWSATEGFCTFLGAPIWLLCLSLPETAKCIKQYMLTTHQQ
jgi:hypothetical protein